MRVLRVCQYLVMNYYTTMKTFEPPKMPEEVAFIGAGFIAIEFAGIAKRQRAKVHAVAKHERHPLREFDQDLTQDLIAQMESKGITFHWNFDDAAVEETADGRFDIVAADGRRNKRYYLLQLVVQVIQEDLNLEAAGAEVAGNGIKVMVDLRTTNPNIFAVGDAAESPVPKLTPTGAYEARAMAGLLTGTEPEEIS